MFTQRAWADREGYFFPLLSDYWPHGEVTQAFGVLNERTGAPIRGTFLIGLDGIVRWSLVNGPGERRDFGGLPAPGRRPSLTVAVCAAAAPARPGQGRAEGPAPPRECGPFACLTRSGVGGVMWICADWLPAEVFTTCTLVL